MSKKIPLIIICCFLIIIVLVLLFVKKEDKPSNKDITSYLLIDNQSTWRYKNKKFTKVSTSDVDNNEYDVYINSEYFGHYKLLYGTVWNLFDKNNNYINYDGNLIAASNTLKLIFNKYTVEEVNNIDINTIADMVDLNSKNFNLSTNEKVVIDLDNNGTLDSIICVSNLDSPGQIKYFDLVYVIINGESQILVNRTIKPENVYIEPIYSIKNIINIDNEEVSSILLQKGYFSEEGSTKNSLFQYKDKKYEVTIED